MHTTVRRWFTALLCITLYLCDSHVTGYTYGECTTKIDRGPLKFFCYKKKLNRVPQNLPLDIIEIDISYNKISRIKSGDFQNLTHVIALNISYNNVSHVETGAFKDLTSLTELGLSGNKLTKITNDFFYGLVNLRVALLEKNKIFTIENSSFSALPHLECVKLSGNKLRHMKQIQPIFRMQTLNELHISSNNISVFQSIDISSSPLRLETLNLSHNPINVFRISRNIFPSIKTIDLSGCFSNRTLKWEVPDTGFFGNLTRLYMAVVNVSVVDFNVILRTFNKSLTELAMNAVHPAKSLISSICLIPRLTNLALRNNSIRSLIGTGLEKCCHLSSVDLSNNNLDNLGNVFISLTNLTSLDLSYNTFSKLPNVIQNLTMLENLNFVFNEIESLDYSTFKNLTNLKALYLYNNNIIKLNGSVFQDLINLKELYLGSNGIKSLVGAFRNGPARLEYLGLSANSIGTLHADDFSGLKSLRILDLNDNKITSIDNGAFHALINLRMLNLRSNKIGDKSLKPTIFAGLIKLSELSLQNNHILKTKGFKKPPFCNLKSLQVLSVLSQPHHESQSFLPSIFLQNLTNLVGFWAQNIGLKYLPVDLFKDNTQLTELALSENDLTILSPDVFLPLKKLYMLYLKETRLKTLDFLLQANLHRLHYLQVSNNQISSINETIVKSVPGLRLLDMQGNTFTCDCTNAWFINWTKADKHTQVLATHNYECNSPPNLKETNVKLLEVDLHSCSVNIEIYCYIFSTSLVLLTMFISLIYRFLRWQLVYAYYLFVAYLYDNKKQGSHKLRSFQYDAFVSYNTHDELWVTNELLPKLEGEQGWRLCLHHRDFQPGKPIVDNIVDGIYGSRKTICIISQHYLESEWCSREVQVASFRLFDEKKDVLILVFLEDIPAYRLSPYHRMRSLVKKRTYLSWPKAGQDTQVFWEKLRVALGARRGSEEKCPLSDV